MHRLSFVAFILASFIFAPAMAQENAREEAIKRQNAYDSLPPEAARRLFGEQLRPAPLAARSIGFYSKGCLAGAIALPVNGKSWQVMRLSRNRNWGHPDLIAFLERFAQQVPKAVGWPGILVGDMSQPRGGPMLTGHASHQIGLDADIWLTPMPSRTLSREDRDEMRATNVVAADWQDIDPRIWSPQHLKLLKLAAHDPAVERVLVNPAIKKALCREAGRDRDWLSKIRPVGGHNYHFHIRISCPKDAPDCRPQARTPQDDGCGKDLAWWFRPKPDKPKQPDKPYKPPPPLLLSDLPPTCRQVLLAR